MDTGISVSWLIDNSCNSSACNGRPFRGFANHKFNTDESSTFHINEESFEMFYGDGICTGYSATDAFSFAGLFAPLGCVGQDRDSNLLNFIVEGKVDI